MNDVNQVKALTVEFIADITVAEILTTDQSSIFEQVSEFVASEAENQNSRTNIQNQGNNKIWSVNEQPEPISKVIRPDSWIVMSFAICHKIPNWKLKFVASINLTLPTFPIVTEPIQTHLAHSVATKKENIEFLLVGVIDEALRDVEKTGLVEGDFWTWSVSTVEFSEFHDHKPANAATAVQDSYDNSFGGDVQECYFGHQGQDGKFQLERRSFGNFPPPLPTETNFMDNGVGSSKGKNLQEALEKVEQLAHDVTDLRRHLAGIGDNNPPEPIEENPLDDEELQELEESTKTIKKEVKELIATQTNGSSNATVTHEVSKLEPKAEKIKEWLHKQYHNFIEATMAQILRTFLEKIISSIDWLIQFFLSSF